MKSDYPHWMHNNFYIRPATNEDIPEIKKIVFTSLREYGLQPDETGIDNNLNDVEKNFFRNKGFFGVLVDSQSDNIIGTFGLTLEDEDTCELRKMFLLKEFRGKGLGKFMMTTAIAISKQMQATRITLDTVSVLKEAISLYKQFGFKEITTREISDRVDQAYELLL